MYVVTHHDETAILAADVNVLYRHLNAMLWSGHDVEAARVHLTIRSAHAQESQRINKSRKALYNNFRHGEKNLLEIPLALLGSDCHTF